MPSGFHDCPFDGLLMPLFAADATVRRGCQLQTHRTARAPCTASCADGGSPRQDIARPPLWTGRRRWSTERSLYIHRPHPTSHRLATLPEAGSREQRHQEGRVCTTAHTDCHRPSSRRIATLRAMLLLATPPPSRSRRRSRCEVALRGRAARSRCEVALAHRLRSLPVGAGKACCRDTDPNHRNACRFEHGKARKSAEKRGKARSRCEVALRGRTARLPIWGAGEACPLGTDPNHAAVGALHMDFPLFSALFRSLPRFSALIVKYINQSNILLCTI